MDRAPESPSLFFLLSNGFLLRLWLLRGPPRLVSKFLRRGLCSSKSSPRRRLPPPKSLLPKSRLLSRREDGCRCRCGLFDRCDGPPQPSSLLLSSFHGSKSSQELPPPLLDEVLVLLPPRGRKSSPSSSYQLSLACLVARLRIRRPDGSTKLPPPLSSSSSVQLLCRRVIAAGVGWYRIVNLATVVEKAETAVRRIANSIIIDSRNDVACILE